VEQKTSGKKLVLLAIITLLIFLSYSGNCFATQKESRRTKHVITKNRTIVTELRNLEQLKKTFQRDAGKIRLITILSPT
jgi:hypothetical protein